MPITSDDMSSQPPHRIKTIPEYHRFRGLPAPEHPLISIIDIGTVKHLRPDEPRPLVTDFYLVGLKRNVNAKMKYGQQEYDFDEGVLSFLAPGQVFSLEAERSAEMRHTGWVLMFHPDFLWNTPLAQKINRYDFFGYAVNEALHLSEREEAVLQGILQTISQEYRSAIDKFSQDIIVSQLDTLFSYADRFYQRQFVTRKISNHKILDRLEKLLADYFDKEDLDTKGLPSVQSISEELNVSPTYLRSLLKVLTGQNTQQLIHEKLIEKAKEKLSTTDLSVSEIAYGLGFEHPQSFSKLFKSKTHLSPLEFRQSFN